MNSQVNVTHVSDRFKIESGTVVYINGSFETYGNGTVNKVANLGDIYLTDTLRDYGDQGIFGAVPGGTVHFIGTNVQTIIGGDTINFNGIELNNAGDTLTLNQNIWVQDTLDFVQGNIFLNSNEVMLKLTGHITNEEEGLRMFSYPGEVTLERTFLGGVPYADAGGMGMDVRLDGGTSVKVIRVHTVQASVANGSIDRLYTLQPAATDQFYVPSQVRYFDPSDLAGQNESELSIYTSESGGLTWRDKGGTVNTASDHVTGAGTELIDLDITNHTIVTLAEDSCDFPPYVDILEDTIPLCSGASAWIYADGASGNEIIWSTGTQGIDSIQVSSVGQYIVTIIDDGGCYASDTVEVVDSQNPDAGFSTSVSECIGTAFSFTNTSTVLVGTLTYEWDFNDVFGAPNDTSTQVNPSYTYSQLGTYTVELTATSAIGCVDTYSANVIVKPYPVADFSAPAGCSDSTLSFINNSSVTPAAGITYEWDFGDGSGTSTATNPNYAYMSNGTYTVELIATSNGCRDTTYETVNVNPNPAPNFNYTNECPGVLISFDNTTPPVGMVDYTWDFGDGSSTTTLMDPTYAYSSSGSYSVTLTAETNQGCVDSITQTVTIYDVPSVSFTIADTCATDIAVISNTSTITSGSMTYVWDLGDGTGSVLTNPVHSYSTAGNYTVQLIATSNNGCVDSTNSTVDVYPNPVAAYVASDECEGTAVTFNNTSTISSGSLSYQWSGPGIGTSTSTHESATYSTAGIYNIQLIATSAQGCDDTVTNSIEIYANPVVVINGGGSTCGSTSNLWVTNPGTYLWNTSSTNDSILATFDGNYSIIVTSAEGCRGYDTTNVVLNAEVLPTLGPDATFCDSAVLDAGYPGSSFDWNTTDTTQTITVFTSGTYIVEVTDPNSCLGSDTINVVVAASTPVNLGADVSQCDGNIETLDAGVAGMTYNWSTAETTQTIDVTTTGTYWVELTNTDNCVTSDTIVVTFNPIPSVNLGPDSSYCDSVTLDATSSGASYTWSDSSTDATLFVTSSGLYWAEAVIGSTGCMDRDSVNVIINTSPTLDLGNDTTLCSYESITLDAENAGSSYAWSEGSTTQTITLFASGDYSVLVTDVNNCTVSDTISVTVNPVFQVDLGADQNLCAGADATLFSGVAGGTYAWYDHSGLLDTTQNIVVTDTGHFWVDVIDSDGCIASDTVWLYPTSLSLYAVFLAQSEVFEGDSVVFVNLSYPRPYDSWWDMGDGWNTTDSTPTHVYLDTGYYDVTLAVTNSQCTDSLTKTIHVVGSVKTQEFLEEDLTLFNEIEDLNLYPNPNDGAFSLYIKLKEPGTTHIDVFNLMGQLIDYRSQLLHETTLEYQLNGLTPGVYIVRVRVRESVKTLKFVLVH